MEVQEPPRRAVLVLTLVTSETAPAEEQAERGQEKQEVCVYTREKERAVTDRPPGAEPRCPGGLLKG